MGRWVEADEPTALADAILQLARLRAVPRRVTSHPAWKVNRAVKSFMPFLGGNDSTSGRSRDAEVVDKRG